MRRDLYSNIGLATAILPAVKSAAGDGITALHRALGFARTLPWMSRSGAPAPGRPNGLVSARASSRAISASSRAFSAAFRSRTCGRAMTGWESGEI